MDPAAAATAHNVLFDSQSDEALRKAMMQSIADEKARKNRRQLEACSFDHILAEAMQQSLTDANNKRKRPVSPPPEQAHSCNLTVPQKTFMYLLYVYALNTEQAAIYPPIPPGPMPIMHLYQRTHHAHGTGGPMPILHLRQRHHRA